MTLPIVPEIDLGRNARLHWFDPFAPDALEKTIVHDDAAWLPLFSVDHLYVLNPRVKNFVVPWNVWRDMSYHLMDVE